MLEPHQALHQARKLSTQQRLQLIHTLNQLTPSQILDIETMLGAPQRRMTELIATQAQRSAWLFRHLEGPGGWGLNPLLEVLESMNIAPFTENTPPLKFDLQCADLRGVDLRGTNLQGANLRSAKLRRAKLSHTILRCADLSRAVLSRAILRGTDLSGALLCGAILSDAVLHGAVLRDTDLTDALVGKALFGNNLGLTEQDKDDLKQRGAIFQETASPNAAALTN